MPLEPTRVDISRAMLERAFYFALGSYMEQESKKDDQWRDQTIGQLYDHLLHELEEIRRNLRDSQLTFLVHNSVDAVSLATILLAKAMLQAGMLQTGPDDEKVVSDV